MKKSMTQAEMFASLLKAAVDTFSGQNNSEKMSEGQETKYKLIVNDVNSGKNDYDLECKAFVGLAIKKGKDGKGVGVDAIIHGGFGMMDLMAAIESLDELKDQLVEHLVRANLK